MHTQKITSTGTKDSHSALPHISLEEVKDARKTYVREMKGHISIIKSSQCSTVVISETKAAVSVELCALSSTVCRLPVSEPFLFL